MKSILGKKTNIKMFALLILFIVGIMFIFSFFQDNIPKNRKLSSDICLYFIPNIGSDSYVSIATVRCDELKSIPNNYQYFSDLLQSNNKAELIASVDTMNCPKFNVQEREDKIEIVVTKNSFCDFFKRNSQRTGETKVNKWIIYRDGTIK